MDRSPADVYADHCRRRELAYQIDPEGRPVFRPRVGPFTWAVSEGRGAVYATTVMRRRDAEPGHLCLVDVDEGFRMMSRIVGVAPDEVRIGMRVRVAWEDGDPPLPVFEVDA